MQVIISFSVCCAGCGMHHQPAAGAKGVSFTTSVLAPPSLSSRSSFVLTARDDLLHLLGLPILHPQPMEHWHGTCWWHGKEKKDMVKEGGEHQGRLLSGGYQHLNGGGGQYVTVLPCGRYATALFPSPGLLALPWSNHGTKCPPHPGTKGRKG